jgi:uncharacterized protein (TIGR03435 family)
MLQALLAERFKLVIRRETKHQSVYALVVAKGGPKLNESEPDPPAPDTPLKLPTLRKKVKWFSAKVPTRFALAATWPVEMA